MAVSPYDQAAWSTYTPLSSQEILQPALMMRERHDRLDEEYAAIDDELQKIAFIAETESDPAIKQIYSNYSRQLESGINELSERGITPNSRRKMLGLRSQYQSQIAPIKSGYELKLQDMNMYNQLKMKDPTWIGQDPSSRSVSDYLANGLQPFAQQGMSGAMLVKMSQEQYAPYAKILNSKDPAQIMEILPTLVGEKELPAFLNILMQRGYSPDDPDMARIRERIVGNIMSSTGIDNWEDEGLKNQAYNYIAQGETAAIGGTESKIVQNPALAMESAMARALAKGANLGGSSAIPEFRRQPGSTETYEKKIDNIKNNYSSLIKYSKEGKLFGVPMKVQSYAESLYKKAIDIQKDIANMSEAEIDAYFEKNPFIVDATTYRGAPLGSEYKSKVDATNALKEHSLALRDYKLMEKVSADLVEQEGISPEQAEQMAKSYLDSTSTMLGTTLVSNYKGSEYGEKSSFQSTIDNLGSNSKAVITIDGKRKRYKDIKSLQGKISKEGRILGHNRYNAETGESTVIVEYTPGKDEDYKGKTIRVEIPDANLSKQYSDTRKILEVIKNSNTYLPKEISLSNDVKAYVFSAYEGGQWNHYIDIGGAILPIEEYMKQEEAEVNRDLYDRSLTGTQLRYSMGQNYGDY